MGSTPILRDIPDPIQQEVNDFVELQKDIYLFEQEIFQQFQQLTDDNVQHSSQDSSIQALNPQLHNQIHPSKKNFIPQITFTIHNINGLRTDQTKLD